MHDRNTTIALYAAGATVAALGLAYILGPSIFPDDAGYRDSRVGGVVGLSNPANDCFINSVLQALAGVEGLKEYVKEIQEKYIADNDYIHVSGVNDEAENAEKHDESKVDVQRILVITSALMLMLEKLSERPAYRKTISARDFISTLEHVFRSNINRRQQDAQEFLQVILEKLADEHLALSQSIAAEQNEAKAQLPVAGSISSQITCLTCGFQPEPNISSFLTLTLNVPHVSSNTTLDACLDGLLKVETIDDYKCQGCMVSFLKDTIQDELSRPVDPATKEKLEAILARMNQDPETWASQGVSKIQHSLLIDGRTDPKSAEAFLKRLSKNDPARRRIQKHTSISKFPPVLVIHLSRSVFDPSAFSTKNTARVEFPEVLVLGSIGEKRRKYHLSTMIIHRGGHNSGHYETFRRMKEDEIRDKDTGENVMGGIDAAQDGAQAEVGKDKDEKNKIRKRRPKVSDRWWRISDNKISECRTKDMLYMQREVYILFYELKR